MVRVPFNDMMAATFALSALDGVHRAVKWLSEQPIDWAELLVIIAGCFSAGLTWQTNSMCPMLCEASARKLDPAKLIIAPFAPTVGIEELADSESCARR